MNSIGGVDGDVEVVEVAPPAGVEVIELGASNALEGAEVVSLGGDLPPTTLTRLSQLADVDAPTEAVGVLTRDEPGGRARFEPLPEIPPPPPLPRRHVQNVPAVRWQVVHDLGYRPHFDAHTPDGELLLALNVEHPVPGSISELVFGAPFAGYTDPS